ncbi:hypothetical protein NON55_000002 [Campylobacter coli]|nr:hypothetical protein [Campylobacter coli]
MSYENFIGKQEKFTENINEKQVQKIVATLQSKQLKNGDALPYLWQWCFFNEALTPDKLGRDGHPKLGLDKNSFLPSFGEVNRMWAGGRFNFIAPLIIGEDATKITTIKKIQEKQGKSGKLTFVTLEHCYYQKEQLKIEEEQDIVYKQPAPPKLTSDVVAMNADYSEKMQPDSTLLFRYSALTFNGHKIHYDFPYAMQVEGYHGLVIHGPLLATYMINCFVKNHPDKQIINYSYRGMHALCVPDSFAVESKIIDNNTAEVWINKNGFVAHSGTIHFK